MCMMFAYLAVHWLQSNDFGVDVARVFEANEVDGPLLLTLSESDIRDEVKLRQTFRPLTRVHFILFFFRAS